MKVDIDTSDKLYADAWLGFKGTDWKNEINVRDFIQHNYTRLISIPILPPQLPLMMRDILTSRWKKLLACKRMRR